MDLRDLIGMSSEDIKRMEMDKHLEKLRSGNNTFDPREEYFYQTGRDLNKDLENVMSYDEMKNSQLELEKIATASEIEKNPLLVYSTTELKRELRRRKGKLK